MPARNPLRPLLVTQFFGAFNDKAWQFFVVVLAKRLVSGDEEALQGQTMLAFVTLTLPLMLFSVPAGLLADRLSKRTLILAMKALEVALMGAGAVALWMAPGSTALPLVVLGCMGVQSALFSPAKYGILPEMLPHERLSRANGALGLWTFVAIIAGTALGPQLLDAAGGAPFVAALALVACGVVGFAAAWRLPRVPAARAEGGLAATLKGSWTALRSERALWLAVLGSTYFWGVASLLGQNLVVYSATVLGLSDATVGMPLALYGIGVGFGSWLAGRLSGGKVETGLIPLGALGLGAITLVFGLLAPGLPGTLVLLALLGLASGFVIVPLDALLQWLAPPERRGGVIALGNVFVFGGTLLGSLLGWIMARQGLDVQGVMIGAAVVTLGGTVWALVQLPEALLRLVGFLYTHTFYRLRVVGSAHVPQEGGVLLTPNHVSFMDGLFVMAALDRPVRFLVDEGQFRRRFFKPFLKLLRAIPIRADGGPRGILRALRDAGRFLDEGEVVCIFPEGQITRTGGMQPFRRGLERIAKGRNAPIVPVHLDRVWGSIFSFAGGRFATKLPEQIPYPVTVSFGEPLPAGTPLAQVRQAVEHLGERAWYERAADAEPLHRGFVRAARRRPWRFAMADATRPRVSRRQALTGAVALARALRPEWDGAERVGVLLPPSVGGALVNVAASLAGKTSVNLNYTAGPAGLSSAARQAGLAHVVTSRAFLEKAGLELPDGLAPVYLEDVRDRVQGALAAVLALLCPVRWLERLCGATRPIAPVDDVATVIFSSGSTGEPKGVMLTHFNLDSNVEAVTQVVRLQKADRLLGILPLFHSFGYLSLWFTLKQGVPIVFHANPVDGPAIGRLVHDYELTMLLGTPTFLQVYLRRCTPEQFGSLRLVIAGAEKMTDAVCRAFEDRFGLRPLEGYGMTECAPVVAVSTPPFRAKGFFQPGSRRGFVGPPVPGVALRVVDPDTGAELPPDTPGMLLVKGPNVMKGYLGQPEKTAEVLADGWYRSGDIALIDDDGFVRITDRLSRFSKIGGEMVPHGRVEEALHEAYGRSVPQVFAVTAQPDERKGERLAVIHTIDEARIPALLERMKEQGLPNLYLPRPDAFVKVEAIPLLGTGKVDLVAVRRLSRD